MTSRQSEKSKKVKLIYDDKRFTAVTKRIARNTVICAFLIQAGSWFYVIIYMDSLRKIADSIMFSLILSSALIGFIAAFFYVVFWANGLFMSDISEKKIRNNHSGA